MKLGADPEFEWYSGNVFVGAENVVRGTHNRLGTDGVTSTGEIRPAPGEPGTVIRSINIILGRAAKFNYDMYAGSGRNVPIGGHIHFSGVSHSPELLAALDKFITIPLNGVSNRRVREGRYGQLSEVRSQPHGWEYRSPLSWLSHPVITEAVLKIAWVLANAYQSNRLNEIRTRDDLIRVIPDYTTKSINWSVTIVKRFYKMLDRMSQHGIKLEQVEVFQAWKKRPRQSGQERAVMPSVRFNLDDENMPAVKAEFDRLCQNVQIEGEVTVLGAARNRTVGMTNAKVIFDNTVRGNTLSEIVIEHWDKSSIGLSYEIRQEPELAARALIMYLKSTVGVSGCAEILNKMEGIKYQTVRVSQVTIRHLDFIRSNGDGHITQESFDYYKNESTGDDILLEYSMDGELGGLCFADRQGNHAITIVRRDLRNCGIGTRLAKFKKKIAAKMGIQIRGLVSVSNPASIRMCSKVFSARDEVGGQYIFHG